MANTTADREPRVPLLIWNEKRRIWETPDEKRTRERSEQYQRDRGNVYQFWADAADATAYSSVSVQDIINGINLNRGQYGAFRYSQDL